MNLNEKRRRFLWTTTETVLFLLVWKNDRDKEKIDVNL